MTDWHAGLAVMAESERFEFGPSVKYTDLIDGDIQDQQNQSKPQSQTLQLQGDLKNTPRR